jgi:formylglycine-generating enzyme required for sulfatase activity
MRVRPPDFGEGITMKRLVLFIALGSLAIGAAACEDTQETQSRSSVCAVPEPIYDEDVAILFVPVPAGDADNPNNVLASLGSSAGSDPVGEGICVDIGSVAYDYEISKYETTNAQYAEFLNSQASQCDSEGRSDPLILYPGDTYGIARTGAECSIDDPYVYTPEPGKENSPVRGTNFFNATRFANWYENGKPAFIPPEPTQIVSQCTNALQEVFFDAGLSGCKDQTRTIDGKQVNLPYENIPTLHFRDGMEIVHPMGTGLTVDTYFSIKKKMFQILVNNPGTPGSDYRIGDTLQVEAGAIKDGFFSSPCNTEATVTLNASHFRTSADALTEAGSADICPRINFARTVPNPDPTQPDVDEVVVWGADVSERSTGAEFFVPSGDEWHKAAYYNKNTASYSDFPTGSDTKPTCACPGEPGNAANCDSVLGSLSDVGAYPDAESWYGTFDQAGNVTEWSDYKANDQTCGTPTSSRLYRGGAYYFDDRPNLSYAQSISAYNDCMKNAYVTSGFRIARCLAGEVCQPESGHQAIESAACTALDPPPPPPTC